MNKKTGPLLFWGMIALYFLFLAFQIFQSDYVMTDDTWSFWHTPDGHSNLDFWAPQGRVLTGYMQQWLFVLAGKIANLKYIRLLSWAGWIGCTILLFTVLKRVGRTKEIVLDDWTIRLTVAYTASSFFALVSISWLVCMEIFIPTLLSLAAGLLLYVQIIKGGMTIKISFWTAILFFLLGMIALFFYQTCFPFILLPFYCIYLSRKDGKFTPAMVAGLFYFFAGLAIYYCLFKYSLHWLGYDPSPRTALKFQPLDRIGFFFASPMNQAFDVAVFFNTGSVLSQAMFPVVFAAWLFFEFRYRKAPWVTKLRYILGLLFWWMLGYLPQLISQETFGPYRSMPVLGTMVFLMIADIVVSLIKEDRRRQITGFSLVTLFLVWGGLVYYAYLARPLRDEYAAVRQVVVSRYSSHIKKVVFVLADEDGFLPHYGVRHYKDEFGLPSTYKDWTPEPLVKQIVYEMTGDRQQADRLQIVMYRKTSEIPDKAVLNDPAVLFIDAHTLF
jgi:hypothetical protein